MNQPGFKFFYFANSDVLIPRSERIYTIRFCEAMAERGVMTELVSLGLKLLYEEPTKYHSLQEVYGIRTPFEITVLPTLTNQNSVQVSTSLHRLVWYTVYPYWKILIHSLRDRFQRYVIYFRNYSCAPAFLTLKKLMRHRLMLIFEARNLPLTPFQSYVLASVDAIAAHTKTLAYDLIPQCNLQEKWVRGVHMGVDLDYINSIRIPQQVARVRVGLPLDRKIVVYTGKVFRTSRIVLSVFQTAKLLPPDVMIVMIGGRSDQIEPLRERIKQESLHNIRFEGFVPPTEVKFYQFAADVLLMDSEDGPEVTYASPGKLFEYMAARVPIVAANHPCFREFLSNRCNAVQFTPDNAPETAQAILEVLSDAELAKRIAERAYLDVQNYTWSKRADTILELVMRFMNTQE